jgi:hypothetical protein
MWPHRNFDLPILGIDAVVINGHMQFFILDGSPVTSDNSLPPTYRDALRMLRAQYMDGLAVAALPDWAEDVFSGDVSSVRPALKPEADLCIMFAVAMARAHLLFAKRLQPLCPVDEQERLLKIDTAHRKHAPLLMLLCLFTASCISRDEGPVCLARALGGCVAATTRDVGALLEANGFRSKRVQLRCMAGGCSASCGMGHMLVRNQAKRAACLVP